MIACSQESRDKASIDSGGRHASNHARDCPKGDISKMFDRLFRSLLS
jgi:hypothetical protein